MERTFISLAFTHYPQHEILKRAQEFYSSLKTRRSVRDFSPENVPRKAIENIIATAASAPSGANKQPWTFCAVSNQEIKKQIRIAAEKEEKEFYEHRVPKEWLDDLFPLGTDWHKEFLETVPWLIVVFKKTYDKTPDVLRKNYYVNESVGIACGFLLAAIHQAGLVTLTHTPSPMGFLKTILERPENETPYLLLPVGYPAENVKVPDIQKKNMDEVAVFYE